MAYEGNSIFWVEVEKIVPNPYQPRREFDESKIRELAESVRMYGVLQPLVVTRREIIHDDGAFSSEYELIAGERRLRASKLAGLTQVPVIIRSGEETELMKLELAIIENLQREDLNAVDRALAFKQLAEKFSLSHSQIAKKVGRSREYVSNSIRLLQLPETILSALRTGDISDGHARTLLMLNDRPEEQDTVFREILFKKLSVREVERISRKIATDKVRKQNWDREKTDPELIAIERQFTETLGTRVQISKTDYGGKLTIDYFSPEDLQKILDLVHREEGHGTPVGPSPDSTAAAIAGLEAATPLALHHEEVKETLKDDLGETMEQVEEPHSPTEEVGEETVPEPKAQDEQVQEPAPTASAPVEALKPQDVGQPEEVPTESQPASEPEPASVAPGEPREDARTPEAPISNDHASDRVEQAAHPEAQQYEETPNDEDTVSSKQEERAREPEDPDLYSIRNFSL